MAKSAYIPLLEVLPEYQNQGIGKKLIQLLLEELKDIYMIDLICDEELQPYYEKVGMMKAKGMISRNYKYQFDDRREADECILSNKNQNKDEVKK